MLRVSIVVIGDEILLGRVVDTNSGAISRAMDRIGAKVENIRVVGDVASDIAQAIGESLRTSDIVFTTGGLGPTKDDITKGVLTEIFGGKIVRDSSVTQNIEQIFAGRQLKLNNLTLDQALVPDSATIIQNRLGTAPIMTFLKEGTTLVAMPGVPSETEGMLPEVVAFLSERYQTGHALQHFTTIVTGISESALAEHLADFENQLPTGYKLAYLPDSPIIRLRLDAPADDDSFACQQSLLAKALDAIDNVTTLGHGEKTLPQLVIETLEARQLTLSTAESCTGGNIARRITEIAGASAIFNGGVVSYANSAKINLLDVGPETLHNNGAVSRQVVVQMVEGACRILSTDCAVATSGIAGPTGGTSDKPVGTVWIAVKTPRGIDAKCYRFGGNRRQVIERATSMALIMLLSAL